jgi:murein DD-endopeptidase MepM/ murein hydrolase activator NlpD
MPLRTFPVAAEGRPTFSDDWHQPRSGGRVHKGTDIFAAEGTPLFAVDDGFVSFGESGLGGLLARLKANDGFTYLYIHLSAFEGENRPVKVGDVIGYVGHTGNAATTPPHCHFEIHPPGEEAINPFPILTAIRKGDPLPLARAAKRAAEREAEQARRVAEQAEQDSSSLSECLPLVLSSSAGDGGKADS